MIGTAEGDNGGDHSGKDGGDEGTSNSASCLIRELISDQREATQSEIDRIVEQMAVAPFDSQMVHVPKAERGAVYRGHVLGARADALTYHLVKRVAIERQWADGTTSDEYLSDLRAAIRYPDAVLVLFRRRGGHLAATITATNQVLPSRRVGENAEEKLIVIYSADRSIIVTGYGISGLGTASTPEEARWLK